MGPRDEASDVWVVPAGAEVGEARCVVQPPGVEAERVVDDFREAAVALAPDIVAVVHSASPLTLGLECPILLCRVWIAQSPSLKEHTDHDKPAYQQY